jgi:poly(hydroxyalkanoate) depolymerase family esterase
MKGVTDTIEQALSAAGLLQRRGRPGGRGVTIDSTAREIHEEPEALVAIERHAIGRKEIVVEPAPEIPARRRGEFLERSFAGATGARLYKVYISAQYSAVASERVPMVVMLHGCSQSPDDFAAGTRMNALADEHGFIVVYPAQSANANVQKCWNWFRTEDQIRESGEAAIIAGITREVASEYRIDERRIFVAGMSAGAAMAVILGATYPDLYAGVGAHSGLAYGAAHDMPSAFGAMHGGSGLSIAASHASIAVPTIVFHGDGDHIVDARNATTIVQQTIARHDRATLRVDATTATAAGGRTYSRTNYIDGSNRVVAEQWTMHGAGHAWSGGSAAGSFTDARGPDASREMIRFFFSLARAGTA